MHRHQLSLDSTKEKRLSIKLNLGAEAIARRLVKPLVSKVFVCLVSALGFTHLHAAETVTYYYTDAQGSTITTTDASSAATSAPDFHPFGVPVGGVNLNTPSWIGQLSDTETGLVYLQARYYDPNVSRFVSVDPVGPSTAALFDFNRYTYGDNNPVNMEDPSGRHTSDEGDGIKGCAVYPCENLIGSSGGGSPHQVDEATINKYFAHFTAGSTSGTSGSATRTPLPPETMAAILKFLSSPIGAKLLKELEKNPTDPLQLVLGSSSNLPLYNWQAEAGVVYYSLQLDRYKAEYPRDADIQNQTLDVILGHEFGHTPQGSRAFGITSQPGTIENEFEVIRKVENPYRDYIHKDLRTHYGKYPIPSPTISK